MVKSGASLAFIWPTQLVTGAAGDADSLPAATLYVDAVANGAAVTVADAGTGLYSASVTLPALTAGQRVQIHATATVGGVAAHGIIFSDQADTNYLSETHASVATRLATSGYTAPDNANIAAGAAAATAAASSAASAASSAATAATGTTTILSKLLKYVQLMVRKDAAIATDNATELTAINASGGSGVGAYVSTTDSQEGIRDAISAGTASAEDIAAELVGVGAYVSSPSQSPSVGSLGTFVAATSWIMPAISVGALPADREKLWFTVKSVPGQDDSAAILMVEETDGLLVLSGAAVVSPNNANAQIVYDDGDDTVTPRVEADATEGVLSRGTLYFDVKYRAAGGAAAHQVAAGTLYVVWGITNAN